MFEFFISNCDSVEEIGLLEFQIYRKTEKKCQLVSKWTLILSLINVSVLVVLPSIIDSIICIKAGNLNTNTWFFALKFSVPFNTSTVFGWYMLLTLETVVACVYVTLTTVVVTYLSSCCLYIKAMHDHFKGNFQKIDNRIIFDYFHLIESKTRNEFKELIAFHVQITR